MNDLPVLLKVGDKYYPAKAIHSKVMELTGELLHRIIDTSQKPQSIVLRAQTLKTERVRTEVWVKAIQEVDREIGGKTLAELDAELNGKFRVVDLETAKKSDTLFSGKGESS